MSLLDELSGQLDSQSVVKLSEQLGIDAGKTKKAVATAMPALISALSRVAEDPDAGSRLAGVVNQHEAHTGSLLDQLGSIFKSGTDSGSVESGQPDLMDFLPDILGKNEQRVERGVSQTAGITGETAGKLIKYMGPIVIGAFAKQLSGKQADASLVNDQLTKEAQSIQQQHGDLLGKLFDQDDDGDFDMSDIADVVMSRIGAG